MTFDLSNEFPFQVRSALPVPEPVCIPLVSVGSLSLRHSTCRMTPRESNEVTSH